MSPVTIDRVETIPLAAPLDEPFGYSQEWVETRTALLVRIEASDGTVGWGECWGPIAGTRETVERLFAPELEGKNPRRIERLSDDLYDLGRRAYQSVVPLPALSGIDIALWDLVGTLDNVPVSTQLGGARRDRVRAYATGHYFKHGADLDEQYDAIAAEARENAAALGAVKAKVGLQLLGHGPDEDVELVRRIREAVGDDTTLMVDANYAYDAGTARLVGRELDALDVYWFEEPVPPEDLDGYASVRDAVDVRVAGGECHAPYEFTRLFARGGLDVAQPDVCNVGGLTAARRVATLAGEYGVPVVPHAWGTPVALAATLHFVSTLPGAPWLEFDRSDNPLREELTETPPAPDADGCVSVPDGPGLGVELDAEALERYRVD